MSSPTDHKAGFVNIIGLPNAGKSTLTNALLGMKLNITNPKPQTTRHRVHAIINDDLHQIIIADTPGFIESPEYAMQESMNFAALSVLEDADVLLFMHDIHSSRESSKALLEKVVEKYKGPIFLLLSKTDLCTPEMILDDIRFWQNFENIQEFIPISSETGQNITTLLDLIKKALPVHPPYYDKEDVSDKSMRFFVSEIIRNQILARYSKEIPYSCEVIVTEYKEKGTDSGKTLIRATIFVMRNSQRQILIGKQGRSIKELGMASRKDIEDFIQAGVYLDLTVKIRENWRNDEMDLKKLGY